MLLLLWLILFAIIFQNFGKVLGIPFLFLDAEYLGRVNFWSYFSIGVTLGLFTMAFHMTAYILDSAGFSFLALTRRPFLNFCINNSILPLAFLLAATIQIYRFQVSYETNTWLNITGHISGLIIGFGLVSALTILYFNLTNKNSLFNLAKKVDRNLRKIKVSRINMANRLRSAKSKKSQVEWYISTNLKPQAVFTSPTYYSKTAILKVFDQHHLNSVLLQAGLLVIVFCLGFFQQYEWAQLPAAASCILLFTLILMVVGAISFWLRSWAFTAFLGIFIILNIFSGFVKDEYSHPAYGLNYDGPKAKYTPEALEQLLSPEIVESDWLNTKKILDNWRSGFAPDQAPVMVLICTSGGGQRSALWTMRCLQAADSSTNGQLLNHTTLMTGASGGMVGAAYFRELILQNKINNSTSPYDAHHLAKISRDNLNPIIFSLVVNDLLMQTKTFTWAGNEYITDRGFAFEQQLNQNTDGVLNKSLGDYREAEASNLVPMLVLAPNITNDGRKLYISSQGVSYLAQAHSDSEFTLNTGSRIAGVDFRALFKNQQADSLRFLSALRMNATFPYITPNQVLPTDPPIETMDSGIADNFGMEDALRFAYSYKDWIAENTSGLLLLCIRDSEKNRPAEPLETSQIVDQLFNPLENIYRNWTSIQDAKNDNLVKYAESWLDVPLHRVELQYIPRTLKKGNGEPALDIERASLNWRLTSREKSNILENIYLPENQEAINQLKGILNKSTYPSLITQNSN